jgi:hypothetical protein
MTLLECKFPSKNAHRAFTSNAVPVGLTETIPLKLVPLCASSSAATNTATCSDPNSWSPLNEERETREGRVAVVVVASSLSFLLLLAVLKYLKSIDVWCLVPKVGTTNITASGDVVAPPPAPGVFGRNLQCKPVRAVNFREEWHWSHAGSLHANMRGIKWHHRL